jgi:hypothetical protein
MGALLFFFALIPDPRPLTPHPATLFFLLSPLDFLKPLTPHPAPLTPRPQCRFDFENASLPGELACCILYHHGGLQLLTDPRLGRTPVAASALSALLPDQFSHDDHGFELLTKLEQKWPAFHLEPLAESVDRQHQELGLAVHHDSTLLQWCKKLGQGASAAPAQPFAAAAIG